MNYKQANCFIKAGIVLFFITYSFKTQAQNFRYSNPLGNYDHTTATVIGKVKNNIIVSSYALTHDGDNTSSKFFIYNNEMEEIGTPLFKTNSPSLPFIQYINEKNSFASIIQYKDEGFFISKIMSFNENAQLIKTTIIEKSAGDNKENFEIIHEKESNSIALIKIDSIENNNVIFLHYNYLHNDSVIHSGNIILPFNVTKSILAKAYLDNEQLLLPVVTTDNNQSSLSIYKYNLSNDSSINMIRYIDNKFLVAPSINITKNKSNYSITSLCYDQEHSGNELFLWQLKSDLSDIKTDTVFNNTNENNTCLQQLYFNGLTSFASGNNSSNIVLSTLTKGFIYSANSFYNSDSYNNVPPTTGGSFYEGRILSITSLPALNGNGVIGNSNVYNGPTWNNTNTSHLNYITPKQKDDMDTYVLMNISENNKVNWITCLNSKTNHKLSPHNDAVIYLNNGKNFHLIYSKPVRKNQDLNDIIFNNDGSYFDKPIISMNLKCTYHLQGSFQLDDNSLLIPCTVKQHLVFARLQIK